MKIGIIGLGLIGGSIYKDLKALGYDVVKRSAQGCDIVFVCRPMSMTLETLDELETIVEPQTIVADVCSLKKFVCEKPRPYRFVPTHPMAGSEKKGFENSQEGLFQGAKWVITGDCPPELLEIIEKLGAQPVFMDADEHDRAAALISHMPMVVAQGIFLAAQDNPQAMQIAASGFRDMTRLAMSNEVMAADMVNMNAQNIQSALLKLYGAIGELLGNYPELTAQIKAQRLNVEFRV